MSSDCEDESSELSELDSATPSEDESTPDTEYDSEETKYDAEEYHEYHVGLYCVTCLLFPSVQCIGQRRDSVWVKPKGTSTWYQGVITKVSQSLESHQVSE